MKVLFSHLISQKAYSRKYQEMFIKFQNMVMNYSYSIYDLIKEVSVYDSQILRCTCLIKESFNVVIYNAFLDYLDSYMIYIENNDEKLKDFIICELIDNYPAIINNISFNNELICSDIKTNLLNEFNNVLSTLSQKYNTAIKLIKIKNEDCLIRVLYVPVNLYPRIIYLKREAIDKIFKKPIKEQLFRYTKNDFPILIYTRSSQNQVNRYKKRFWYKGITGSIIDNEILECISSAIFVANVNEKGEYDSLSNDCANLWARNLCLPDRLFLGNLLIENPNCMDLIEKNIDYNVK